MGETTGISWCDATFNPWIGCTKVSPACDGCYAEAMMGEAGRYKRVVWGKPGAGAGTRSRTAAANWKHPLKWDRQAAAEVAAWRSNPFALLETPKPRRLVFCASLADVFDNEVPAEWRRDLFDLIRATPNLTWLLLTKRPTMIVKLFAATLSGISDKSVPLGQSRWPRNAAIGTTVEDQTRAEQNIPALLAAKAALNPAFAFLSMEPLLGPVDLENIWLAKPEGDIVAINALSGSGYYEEGDGNLGAEPCHVRTVDWVITGGETDQGAHKARPTHPGWLRAIRDACFGEDKPYHHKQNGEWLAGHQYTAELAALDAGDVFSRFDSLDWEDGEPVDSDEFDLGEHVVYRVGKKRSGRLLDGVVHDAMPAIR